jgi:hypothetical protein
MKRVGGDLVFEPVVREHQRVKLVHVAAEFSIPVNRIHLAEGAWIVAYGIVNPHSLSYFRSLYSIYEIPGKDDVVVVKCCFGKHRVAMAQLRVIVRVQVCILKTESSSFELSLSCFCTFRLLAESLCVYCHGDQRKGRDDKGCPHNSPYPFGAVRPCKRLAQHNNARHTTNGRYRRRIPQEFGITRIIPNHILKDPIPREPLEVIQGFHRAYRMRLSSLQNSRQSNSRREADANIFWNSSRSPRS